MAGELLSSRAVIGRFYERLESNPGLAWIEAISMYFESDQAVETYPWLGQVPAMREWIGGRQAKGLRENGLSIPNKHFEATLDIPTKMMRRDKTGQVMVRVDELADRTNDHWAKLLSLLLVGGEAAVCYDGQYFFDTDHAEGHSGTQSNLLSVDISALPVGVHGNVALPSVEEMQMAVLQAVQALLGFKDDQGEPINQSAQKFLVMVPTSYWFVAQAATAAPVLTQGQTSIVKVMDKVEISVAQNPRLTWADSFAVMRTDGAAKPFIRQEETKVVLKAKAEGSEFEFDNDAHQYGVDSWRNAGYGYWQHAAKVKLT